MDNGKNIYAYIAKYGPVLQIGEDKDKEKKYIKLDSKFNVENVSMDDIQSMIKFPKNLGKHNNYEISLIEYVNDKTKILEREKYHIQHTDCVNTHTGSFNVNDYYREYRKTHPVKQNKELQKKWYEQNKERISEKQNTKYMCQCGSEILIVNKSRHEKTNKHIYKLSHP